MPPICLQDIKFKWQFEQQMNLIYQWFTQVSVGVKTNWNRDTYLSYAQRGSFHLIEEQLRALVELFPVFSRLRMMRQWAGIVDCAPDASPIIGATPVRNLYVNCGWGTGGFKATPGSGWVFAHHIANDAPHTLNRNFSLERFYTGRLIDEAAAAGVAH